MFKADDIEIPKDELELLVQSDPTLLDFVTKATNAFRTNETIRLACFSSEQMDRSFLKYLLYKLGFRRDVEFLDYLDDPQTKLHKSVLNFLYDEYELAKKDYEMSLASDWISSGNEKSAAAKVLQVLKRETWGEKAMNITNNAPTQIIFGDKAPKKTPAEKVGWQGVDKLVEGGLI